MVIATTTRPPASGGAEINRRRFIKRREKVEEIVTFDTEDKRDTSEKTLATVLLDDESSLDGSSVEPQKRVLLRESKNEVFEIPRVSERYKTRCWITKEELEHNFMMSRVRKLVAEKLVKLLSKNEDFYELTDDADETETETEAEEEEELLDGLLGKAPSTQHSQNQEGAVIKRGMVPDRRERILQHLLDAIMERRKQDIHSFLTSKCSISFSRKPKEKQ